MHFEKKTLISQNYGVARHRLAGARRYIYGQARTPHGGDHVDAAGLGRWQHFGRMRAVGKPALLAAGARAGTEAYGAIVAALAKCTHQLERKRSSGRHGAYAEYYGAPVRLQNHSGFLPARSKRRTRTVMAVARATVAAFHHYPGRRHNLRRVHLHCDKSAAIKHLLQIFLHDVYIQKRVSLLHRTATTRYPCFGQDLGEFSGSWSCRTYPAAKVRHFFVSAIAASWF